MPAITDRPPEDTRQELTRLRRQLTRDVPRKSDKNLLIATWNIREFGGLTEKWRASTADTPKRDLYSLLCIGDIVSRYEPGRVRWHAPRLVTICSGTSDDQSWTFR